MPRDSTEYDTRTLAAAARTFWTFRNAWLLAGALVAFVAVRVAVGRWSAVDLVLALGIVLLQPFTEWVLHVTVLHLRPFTVLGRRVDPYVAREHRRHHAEPRDLAGSFVPPRVLAQAAVLAGGLCLLAPTWGLRLTAAATISAMAFAYEWTHYLIHSDYQPRTAAYRRLRQAHRLHHFRNEQNWFGVTSRLGDRVLGTSPAVDTVPVSKTCRTLGVG